MAQITIAKLNDGPRNAVFHVSILGDGGGDLVDQVLVDPATSFEVPLPPVPSLKISRLWHGLVGFDARLEYDYLTSDTPIWSIPGGEAMQLDFDAFGGLSDRSNQLDGSGKLQITTSGLGIGDFGTLILLIRKS